uniref:Cardiomyopathy-associated protein 5 n=1 Tax=Knipowitschia caucasica TaxID=637954 RepID=A0AAV2MSN4_KNICA
MDEPESLDSDMPELQECSYDALEALSQDDEEEVEELENSLREVIQDHSVKPKLQCLMVDPSFSMVTVQSEDSGIVWETASSRCSTPWASETSSVSEGGSMEASGAAGNITIIFDEDKVVRRRTRSGRSSRLSDRFSRPGSSRSASALGVERLEMMEVSQPNVKQDKTENEPDLEEIKNKDQELFNLIAEGYEILNIRVPFKLPTVDEESTELQDNLSYLDQTPKIKSRNHHHQQLTRAEEGDLQDVEPLNKESKEAVPNLPSTPDFKPAPTEGPGDIDYFEKFTLLDVVAPGEEASGEVDECVTPVPTPEPETKDPVKNRSPSVSEESFVFVSNEDIVGEHLDEVFYGESPPADAVHKQDAEDKGGRMRRQSSVKESGSVLFESEETVLTPIYISSGPPKIIDQILLDEPTAMSFMYTDLYEDAMGEKRRSDEECSEAESVTSEKSYKRCLMDDYEEADGGYLEKFTLKDETAYVEVSSEVVEERKGGRMMWLQNEFEMSGCLTRVAKEEDEDVSMQEDSEKQAPSDVTMEYEIITEQDVTEIEQMHEEKAPLVTDELLEDVMEEPAGSEEVAEVDYDTIDAEEEQQARMAAELEGLDWFCLSCECLLSEEESSSEPHQDHKVIAVDRAYGEIMDKLSDWISELQGRSENIEDLVSELELAYNSVEDQFHENEVDMQAQKEEMMTLVMEQYNSMSVSMEEEKKAKLEQLYDQIVSLQESIETAKGTLETTAREAETDARSPEDIHGRLTAALDSTMSLELGPKGLLVFEDYAKGNPSSSQLAQRKGIAVPQRPTLQAQEPGSATSSSVTVYWKVNADDIIDCFQVYCMEDPLGAVSEEYRVTVKESYCVLEELEPDKTYKVWVMAVNYTGCSLPSVRLVFKTAPSVPVIDIERCTVMWNTAVLRWSSLGETGLSYTLEHCRQYELEGEGLRTIAGIKNLEYKVLLQPNENYLFYIKAVNEAGSSEQSEAALISTKGMKFHLLKETAHPALELSVDETTLHYSQETYDNMPDKTCPFILGELLPMRGNFYWEYDVSRCTDYRLGVAYSSAASDSVLGEGQGSWCLQCTPTLSGCSYRLLHNDVHSSLFVIDSPERVGVFLDHQFGRLSFYNAQSGQLLGSFSERLTQPCHPALGMDSPGSVEVCMVTEVPDFTKDS